MYETRTATKKTNGETETKKMKQEMCENELLNRERKKKTCEKNENRHHETRRMKEKKKRINTKEIKQDKGENALDEKR